VDAYFDGTERDSVLGTYAITEEGETTLEAPLGPYRVTAEKSSTRQSAKAAAESCGNLQPNGCRK
jgi:hypothetical protein